MNAETYLLSRYPFEGGGYFKNDEFFPIENVAKDPLSNFAFDGRVLLEKPELIIHSHPRVKGDADEDLRVPSLEDMQGQLLTGVEWGIYVINEHDVEETVFWGNPRHRPPLVDREFIYNVQDCLSYVQDWYYSRFGIVLPNVARHPNWDQHGETYVDSLYRDWGFDDIEMDKAEVGDVLMFRCVSATTNHLAIYLGDNRMVHHALGQVPVVESVGQLMRKFVRAVRHRARQHLQGSASQ